MRQLSGNYNDNSNKNNNNSYFRVFKHRFEDILGAEEFRIFSLSLDLLFVTSL